MIGVPYIAFLPCPSVISSCLDPLNHMHNSSQIFIRELHTERFSLKSTKNFKGIGTHSIRDRVIDVIQKEFESVYDRTKNLQQAILAVDSLGIALSVLEDSGRSEFKNLNLHTSILELAKDLSEDLTILRVVIVCNCTNNQPLIDARNQLIRELEIKNGEKTGYTYNFELYNTDDLIRNPDYHILLTIH